jgi:hypothetical protein
VQAHHIQEKPVTSIYILEGGPDAAKCAVDRTTGACSIRQGVSLADKGNSTIEIDVKEVVIDGATAGATNIVRVIAPVSPSTLALRSETITMNEGPLPGALLGQLTASGGTYSYTYSAGSGNNGSMLVSSDGFLTVASSLGALATPSLWQYTNNQSFTFPVAVSDGVTTATATVTIVLLQVPTAPAATNASISISEALTVGTEIASPTNFGITAADFTLASISGDSSFLIHPTTGVVTLNRSLDALVIDSFSRFVTFAKDVNGQALSSSPSLTIAVQIANRAPTIGITGAVTSLPEATSTTSAVAVGTITITEIDGGQGTNVLAISGADAASFELGTPTTAGAVTSYPLRLKAGTDLDFTVKTSYSITITSSDAALPGQNKTLNYSLAITNSNVAPTAPATASFSVPDNRTIGSVVGTITVTDPGDTITASIQTDDLTSPGIFAVANNGQITVAQTIPIASSQATHSQVIRWTDSRGAFSQTTVTYNITASTRIVNATYSVDEDEPIGFTIATLPATFGGNTLTYAITSGDPGNQFTFDGNALEVASALDFETNETHTLTVTATETGGTNTATITINVNDISEPAIAPTISGGPFTINENQPIGTTVGTLTFTRGNDPNATISLAMNGAGGPIRFTINNSGVITTTEVLDYESATSQDVTATITNSHSSASVNFTISTGNLTNEFIFSNPGSFVIPSTSLEVSGGTVIGTAKVLGTPLLDATAAGPSSSEILFTVNSATACKFKVNGIDTTTFTRQQLGSGLVTFVALTTATAGNYISTIDQLSPVFTLTVSDTGATGIASKTTTITPIFSAEFIYSNITGAGVVTSSELQAISIGDTAAETEFLLLSINNSFITGGQFERAATPGTAITTWTQAEINANEITLVQTGLTTITSLRARGSNGYLSAGASDTVANNAPTAINFSPASPSFLSTIAAATTIATATAVDPESTAGGSYSLGGANASLWAINASSGVITRSASGSLTVGASSLSVTFADNGGETFTETLNFTILAPPTVSLAPATASTPAVAAGGPAGVKVADITRTPVGATLGLTGADAAKFSITTVVGELWTKAGEELVASAAYTANVTATANGGTASAAFTLNINAAFATTLSQYSLSRAQPAYGTAAVLATINSPAGSTLTVQIVSGGSTASNYQIVGAELRTNSTNNPSVATHVLFVRATLNSVNYDSPNFTLTLSTPPTVSISPTAAFIYPVAAGSNSGTNVSTITSGPVGATLAVVGANASKFDVSGNQLRAAPGVDIVALDTYVCNVTSTSNGATATSAAFTLTVRTAAGPSGAVTLSQNSLSAIQPTFGNFAHLAHVTAALNSTLTVISVSGAAASAYVVFGTQIRTNSSSAPAVGSHQFRVRATEPGGATFDSEIYNLTMLAAPTVSISPTTLNLAALAAGSNSGQNIATITSGPVGTVLALTGANTDKFAISGNQLRTAAGVDLVGGTVYTCSVTSTANGATATSAQFVLGINTAPGPSGQVTLSQNSFTGVRPAAYATQPVLCHVTAAAGATLTVVSVSGAGSGNYTVTGTRITSNSFNPPVVGTHTFRVRATEGSTPFDSEIFTLVFT